MGNGDPLTALSPEYARGLAAAQWALSDISRLAHYFAFRKVPPDLHDDAAAVFVATAYEVLPRIVAHPNPRAYIIKCGLQAIYRLRRHEYRHHALHRSLDAPFVQGEPHGLLGILTADDPGIAARLKLELADLRAALDATLRRLPVRDRRILRLRFGQGLSFKTIGPKLHISGEAARQRCVRALDHARTAIVAAHPRLAALYRPPAAVPLQESPPPDAESARP